MSDPDQGPGGLRRVNRFDYFGDHSLQARGDATSDLVWHTDDVDKPRFGTVPKRRWRRLFKLFFVGFCAWFAWQYHDAARYSFRAPYAPLQLGDVTSLTPDLVQHNTYVCVEGISEHRGMTQKVSRVLGEAATPYWFFRLVGSRGIFVEVRPDPERFSTMQRMQVCGRAVDPLRSPTYAQLIAAYEALFLTEVASPSRIVEADMVPGAYRNRYAGVMAVLVALMGLQGWLVWRQPG